MITKLNLVDFGKDGASDQKALRLAFDFRDGKLFWKIKPAARAYLGDEAGYVNPNGYRFIRMDRKSYLAHRLVWVFHNGYWPNQIDHINGNKTDNRIENLRNVTASENCKNKKMYSGNTSGVAGVYWNKKCGAWKADIKLNNKLIYLGLFSDLESARSARKAAEKQYGFHQNHGRR